MEDAAAVVEEELGELVQIRGAEAHDFGGEGGAGFGLDHAEKGGEETGVVSILLQ